MNRFLQFLLLFGIGRGTWYTQKGYEILRKVCTTCLVIGKFMNLTTTINEDQTKAKLHEL